MTICAGEICPFTDVVTELNVPWYDVARRAWIAQHSPMSIEDVLALHLRVGVVWSGPRSFAFARLVHTKWPIEDLLRPAVVALDGDAWWLYVLAGDWRDAVSHLPEARPWIGWERHGRARWHRTDVIVRKAFQ